MSKAPEGRRVLGAWVLSYETESGGDVGSLGGAHHIVSEEQGEAEEEQYAKSQACESWWIEPAG